MLGIFVKSPWPSFYIKGMKTWEIRSYPTEYRGDILLIESGSNQVICKMSLIDCIPLSKERWEMNFEKHRTSCSYEDLPYRKNGSPAYAWVLKSPLMPTSCITIQRTTKQTQIELLDTVVCNEDLIPICFSSERIACKFIGDTMLLYWMKKNYFALVAVVNLISNNTKIITAEISHNEVNYIINQLTVK